MARDTAEVLETNAPKTTAAEPRCATSVSLSPLKKALSPRLSPSAQKQLFFPLTCSVLGEGEGVVSV